MFCSAVTDTDIFQTINRLNNKKSPGPDNIGPRLLKEIATEIVGPLVYLFKLSLLTGLVPDSLKITRVISVFKKVTVAWLKIIGLYPCLIFLTRY